MQFTVNMLDLIPPTFYEVFLSEQENILLSGGRSSFKSTVISQKLALLSCQEPNANFVIMRKVGNTLRTSVYNQIKTALTRLNITHLYDFRVSPMTILRRDTGAGFYFFGVDDPVKIKSAIFPTGYVRALWFEETAEYDSPTEIDIVQDTFIREKTDKPLQTYYSYNPPRNPFDWINDWKISKYNDPSFLLHHSTYLDDKLNFLSQQMVDKIERYKELDFDYYRWQYLGEVIGLGEVIYNMDMFQPLDTVPVNDQVFRLFFSMDTGYINSATTCLCFGMTRNRNIILLDTYYYSPARKTVKKSPSDLAQDINSFKGRCLREYPFPIAKQTIDSAEGGLRNQIYKDFNDTWHPVSKSRKPTMIDYTYDLLAQGRFYYLDTPNNEIFIDEHKRYQWKADSINTPNPKVVEVDDHTCDAFQYFVKDNLQDLALKF